MSEGKRAKGEDLKSTIQHLLEDVEDLKKRTKHIEEEILGQKRARKWI